MYNGTTTFTSLDIKFKTDSLEKAKDQFHKEYEECSGLVLVIDTVTGESI